MVISEQSFFRAFIRGSSRLLLWVGTAVFLIGDAFLYEIEHVNFLISLAIGILGGLMLMLLGAVIAIFGKTPRQERPQ
jgi:hypothetical protein